MRDEYLVTSTFAPCLNHFQTHIYLKICKYVKDVDHYLQFAFNAQASLISLKSRVDIIELGLTFRQPDTRTRLSFKKDVTTKRVGVLTELWIFYVHYVSD